MSSVWCLERLLHVNDEVFADIVNGLIFNGEQRVNPEDLKNGDIRSKYKADDNVLHELERDVSKNWVVSNVRIAICGIENQTKPEKTCLRGFLRAWKLS